MASESVADVRRAAVRALGTISETGRTALVGAGTFFLPCGFTQAVQVYALTGSSFYPLFTPANEVVRGGLIVRLHREPGIRGQVTGEQAASLALFLRHRGALHTMQQLRAELAELWQRQHAAPEELLAHLRTWCERAERSGNSMLREFAVRLRSYA